MKACVETVCILMKEIGRSYEEVMAKYHDGSDQKIEFYRPLVEEFTERLSFDENGEPDYNDEALLKSTTFINARREAYGYVFRNYGTIGAILCRDGKNESYVIKDMENLIEEYLPFYNFYRGRSLLEIPILSRPHSV